MKPLHTHNCSESKTETYCNIFKDNNNDIRIETNRNIYIDTTRNICILLAENQDKESSIDLSQNENDLYCRYCQFGNCDGRGDVNTIHKKLTEDEKDKFLMVLHTRLAATDNYEYSYYKALKNLEKNKFIEDSITNCKFTYLKDNNYGLLSIVIDSIIKGKLLILNPPLVYILEDSETNEIYHATWCKYCTGATDSKCPSFKNLNERFEPSIKFHQYGVQMCLPVTMTNNGLKIHFSPHIKFGTQEIKKLANSELAKEYANENYEPYYEVYDNDIPFAKDFPIEIIKKHVNNTTKKQKVYNGNF